MPCAVWTDVGTGADGRIEEDIDLGVLDVLTTGERLVARDVDSAMSFGGLSIYIRRSLYLQSKRQTHSLTLLTILGIASSSADRLA